jgi:hypothetical protein
MTLAMIPSHVPPERLRDFDMWKMAADCDDPMRHRLTVPDPISEDSQPTLPFALAPEIVKAASDLSRAPYACSRLSLREFTAVQKDC